MLIPRSTALALLPLLTALHLPAAALADAIEMGGLSSVFLETPTAIIAVTVSPDGENVYAGLPQGLAVFARNDSTGQLSLLETLLDGEDGNDDLAVIASVAVSADGANVYAPSALDDAVNVFDRDADGTLTPVEVERGGLDALPTPVGARAIAISPDDAHVYVAARFADAVVVYERDAATGALTFLETLVEGQGGVSGLEGAAGLALDPDPDPDDAVAEGGAHLYVASREGNALAIFSRDAATGLLTQLGTPILDVAGNLEGATSVAVSPDGMDVYVAAFEGASVTSFARDADAASPDFGTLLETGSLSDGVGGVDGLEGALSVVVRPDPASSVYVGSCIDATVVAFDRSGVDGTLGFDSAEDSGSLSAVQQIAVSPDGVHLYAADLGGVAVFTLGPTDGALDVVDTGVGAGVPEDPPASPSGVATNAFITPLFRGLVIGSGGESAADLDPGSPVPPAPTPEEAEPRSTFAPRPPGPLQEAVEVPTLAGVPVVRAAPLPAIEVELSQAAPGRMRTARVAEPDAPWRRAARSSAVALSMAALFAAFVPISREPTLTP